MVKQQSLKGIQTLQFTRTRKLKETNCIQKIDSSFNHPATEASREVANLTERKTYTPVNGAKEFVCQSLCPSVTMCASSKNGEMGLFRPDLDSVFMLKSNF